MLYGLIMGRISWEQRDKAINKFGKSVVKEARANLTREKANASSSLYSSIRYRFKDNVIEFIMEYYGAFLDRGVTGTGKLWLSATKKMPVAYNKSDSNYAFDRGKRAIGGDLKQWLRVRGIPEKFSFVIRRSIHAKGIRPRRFFTYAFEGEYLKYDKMINKAISDDIEVSLDKILKN
jgi:hypothetical protein